MPLYSIPVRKSILCWADLDCEGSLEDAIKIVKEEIDAGYLSYDVTEGFGEDEYKYEPHEEHYCDEELVFTEPHKKWREENNIDAK